VLDIACGTGGYSVKIAEQGHQVDAIDLDIGMFRRVRMRDGAQVNWVQGDMTWLRDFWPNESFDLIKTIADCHRQLKRNGRLIIGTVNFRKIMTNNIRTLLPLNEKWKEYVLSATIGWLK
jgi:glycine/sarcosine N-methyltransferase